MGVFCTNVAVRLIVVASHSNAAVGQHGHYPPEVALVDDATVVGAGLGVVCVELLFEQTFLEQKCLIDLLYEMI